MPTGRRAGFSLLEVIVATTVVGLIAVSAMAVIAQDLRTLQQTEERLQAEALLTSITLDNAAAADRWTTFAAPFSDYQYRVTLSSDSTTRAIRIVTFTVRWDGGSIAGSELDRP